ncbi:glycosyltransferase [Enterococcus faecalis]
MESIKEDKLKKQIDLFYKTLHTFQKELIADIYPQLVSQKELCDPENWWYVENEGLHVYTLDGELCFANAYNRANYTSFVEGNVAFNRLPDHKISILADEHLSIEIQSEFSEGIKAKLAIVEYSTTEKIKTTLIDLNKRSQIVLHKNTKYLRLAMKISGKGILIIRKITLDRMFNKEKKSTQIHKYSEKIKKFHELKIACIFDAFTMVNYENEVELITFTPENWRTVLTKNKPHLLFVESAWHGNDGTWKYQVGEYSNVSRENLFSLLKWCNNNDIPTIFWNKEDPIHFKKFIDTAKHFDYIYTTDSNMVSEYKKHVNHENVYALPFAVNPKLHNPIQLEEPRKDSICFAGSYYANRHHERREIMDNMLDICKEYGLAIYDRNFERPEEEFKFPKRFKENIIGSLPYKNINKAYKGYRFMLNVNSVIQSPTMFSRRVFEGLASGTPILSSYSEGILEIFDNIVMISEKPSELRKQLKLISENDRSYYRKSLLGIREVYEKHTYKHRLSYILKNMDIDISVKTESITMIVLVKSEEDVKNAIFLFESQSYCNKKLALIISEENDIKNINDIFNIYQKEDINVYLFSYMENYDEISSMFATDWLSYINLENYYGRNYIKDLMLASTYTEADFIGKKTRYCMHENEHLTKINDGQEYIYVDDLDPSSSIVKNRYTFHKDAKQLLLSFLNNKNLNEYKRYGCIMFSSDCFNFVENGNNDTTISRKQVEL